MAHPERLAGFRFPIVTALICGLAIVVHGFPTVEGILIYDRVAIAQGQLWRLATGSLAHYSYPHLLYNLIGVGIVGTLVEIRRIPLFGTLCFASAAAIGTALYLFESDLRFYAGLSGIAIAAIVFLCLEGIRERGVWRRLCTLTLAIVVAKLGYELSVGASIYGEPSADGYVLSTVSHLAGATAATLLSAWSWYFGRNRFWTVRGS